MECLEFWPHGIWTSALLLVFTQQALQAEIRRRLAEDDLILAGLIHATPRWVLDVGCGTSKIACDLLARVDQVDAVDFSQAMIDQGKQLCYP